MIEKDRLVFGNMFTSVPDWFSFNRSRENSLVLFYEDMNEKFNEHPMKIADFVGMKFQEETMDRIRQMVRFESMQQDPKLNFSSFPLFDLSRAQFVRKGIVGDWKNYFNAEQIQYVDRQVSRFFGPVGLSVRYEKGMLRRQVENLF